MKLKFAVNKVSVDDNGGMSAESLGKIYVLAVTYIIFANTDAYTDEIDKRIPLETIFFTMVLLCIVMKI